MLINFAYVTHVLHCVDNMQMWERTRTVALSSSVYRAGQCENIQRFKQIAWICLSLTTHTQSYLVSLTFKLETEKLRAYTLSCISTSSRRCRVSELKYVFVFFFCSLICQPHCALSTPGATNAELTLWPCDEVFSSFLNKFSVCRNAIIKWYPLAFFKANGDPIWLVASFSVHSFDNLSSALRD